MSRYLEIAVAMAPIVGTDTVGRDLSGGDLVGTDLVGTAVAAPRHEALSLAADRMIGEAEMHRLSRRLWSLEIHRRLELQTRRALAS